MFRDGWVCRACWKSNRPADGRCYRCKTPREQQLVVEADSLKERATPGWEVRRRLDGRLGLIAALVSMPMAVWSRLAMVLGVLVVAMSILELLVGSRVSAAVSFGSALAGIGVILAGALMLFVARSVRRHARWAYVVSLLMFGLPLVGFLVVGNTEAVRLAQRQMPAWGVAVQIVYTAYYVASALGSAILLGASFVNVGAGEPAAERDDRSAARPAEESPSAG